MGGDLANEHPYLEKKGVHAHGLRVNTLGPLALTGGRADEAPQQWSAKDELLVPVYGPDGQLWAAQSIDGQGRKSFPRGSKLHGGHFMLGQANEEDVLFLAEGYATAATIYELTRKPVVVGFYSGNLSAVAEVIREQHPEKVILIAGDDDHQKPFEKNVGRQKAEEAAQKVEGHALFPPFDKNASGTDWNDFMKEHGKEQTAGQSHEKSACL
jgi:putative DNA primase/helicase